MALQSVTQQSASPNFSLNDFTVAINALEPHESLVVNGNRLESSGVFHGHDIRMVETNSLTLDLLARAISNDYGDEVAGDIINRFRGVVVNQGLTPERFRIILNEVDGVVDSSQNEGSHESYDYMSTPGASDNRLAMFAVSDDEQNTFPNNID